MENDNAAYRNDLIRRKDLFIFTNATEEQIAHIPAVDAVEVRHGYWLRTLDGNVCSDCGAIEDVSRRFCPQCGCDMRTGV